MEERLQKILSRAGFGSRRECEEFIAAQRVTVNGETAILGMKVDPDRDQIRVDGITINFQEPEKIYVAVNKPRFVLSDRADNDARQTVYQLVPNSETLFVVGRLDFESEGPNTLGIPEFLPREKLSVWVEGSYFEEKYGIKILGRRAPAPAPVPPSGGDEEKDEEKIYKMLRGFFAQAPTQIGKSVV